MHPAPSIIIFTTLSGLGFGMLAFLGFGFMVPSSTFGNFIFYAIAFALACGGLVSSTFHLGHPERAIKAFSQWRSSWLSRVGVLAVASLAVMGLFAALIIFFGTRVAFLGYIGAILSLLTVIATSMIYAQMKTVPRWRHWSTPVMFMVYALLGGALLTGKVSELHFMIPAAIALQLAAWIHLDFLDKTPASTQGTATGLGELGQVRAFEHPHTGDNYLTKEMVFRIGRKHAQNLRIIALLLGLILPLVLLLLPFNHLFGLLAVLSHLTGVIVQRWLFFAEAKHVVGLYYDQGT